MKRIQNILLFNGLGLLVFLFFLFESQPLLALFQKTEDNTSHHSISIDKIKLKESLSKLPNQSLLNMYIAGCEILDWSWVLEKTGTHVVSEVLKGQGILSGIDHYPKSDVYDKDTYAQYYYHTHRKGEHGHFHLFLRQGGMPQGMRPKFYNEKHNMESDVDLFAHLIAISMDKEGYPIKLFTTNRWVTGESWYDSRDVCLMVNLFQIKNPYPSWVTNKWLSSILCLFYPQITDLILQREENLKKHSKALTLIEAMEDPHLDVLSEIEISVEDQMDVLKELCKERGIEFPSYRS